VKIMSNQGKKGTETSLAQKKLDRGTGLVLVGRDLGGSRGGRFLWAGPGGIGGGVSREGSKEGPPSWERLGGLLREGSCRRKRVAARLVNYG